MLRLNFNIEIQPYFIIYILIRYLFIVYRYIYIVIRKYSLSLHHKSACNYNENNYSKNQTDNIDNFDFIGLLFINPEFIYGWVG